MTTTVTLKPRITKSQAADYAKRWRSLVRQSAKLDHEQAALASQVRRHFPVGGSGDHQFRKWCSDHLHMHGATSSMMLRAIAALKKLPKERDWVNLGGWMSVTLLVSLTGQERAKVLKACNTKIAKLGRPISYTTVRGLAFGVGIRSRNAGRNTRYESEVRLGNLRGWVKTLYSSYELPNMPKHVKEAMGATGLSQLEEALRHAS